MLKKIDNHSSRKETRYRYLSVTKQGLTEYSITFKEIEGIQQIDPNANLLYKYYITYMLDCTKFT